MDCPTIDTIYYIVSMVLHKVVPARSKERPSARLKRLVGERNVINKTLMNYA